MSKYRFLSYFMGEVVGKHIKKEKQYSIFFISPVASLLSDYLQSQVCAGYQLVIFHSEQLKMHVEIVQYLKMIPHRK